MFSGTSIYSSSVVEVTRDAVPSVVFEAFVEDQAPTSPKGYFVYRAFRVPALHD